MAARKKTATKRKPAGRKPAKRKVAARRAARPARKAAKKRVAKRPVRKAAKKRVAKRPARKAAKKRVAKRPARKAARKRVAKRPARKAARKRAPAARRAPAAFAPQKAGASAKALLLFELERARVAVLAAIQGLGAGTALQPIAPGKWSIHEIVLHLAVRDRVRLEEFDAMLDGRPASWSGLEDPAEQAAVNEAHLASLRHLSWDETVRLLMTTRAELVERLQGVPAEPEAAWSTAHPFGAMMGRLPEHDRGHAEAIKNARIAG